MKGHRRGGGGGCFKNSVIGGDRGVGEDGFEVAVELLGGFILEVALDAVKGAEEFFAEWG